MKAIEKKTNTTIHDFRGICKLAFIALAVFALVIIPYKVDLNKGSLKATVLLADDSGGDSHGDSDGGSDSDGGHDSIGGNDSDSDHDSDGDHDSYESDQDSDDGEHDGDEHDSDDQKSSHDDSIGSDSSSGSSDELLDVGGMQGLKEIPSEDEASLVGNWGKSSNR